MGYTKDLNTATLKGIFITLLQWQGSIYKLIWKEFLLYFGAFYTFQVIYLVLPLEYKPYYLFAVEYCQRFGGTIPVTLFLGFYVTVVCDRYFTQFYNLPWVTSYCTPVTSIVQGEDETARKYRRTFARYCNLSFSLTMATVSNPAKKRFPTLTHMTIAGLMQGNEQELITSLNTVYHKGFVPIIWKMNLAYKARKANLIKDDYQLSYLIKKFAKLYEDLMWLPLYDFIQLPLVYTQAVTLCVYTFFFSCLLSRQDIDGRTLKVEISFPFFTFLQFFFYVGWLKVAEEMLNPYGEDYSDFGPNPLIDYNFKAALIIMDSLHFEMPSLWKDRHFNLVHFEIPYTVATLHQKKTFNVPGLPLTHGIDRATLDADMDMFLPEDIKMLFELETDEPAAGLITMKKKKPIFVRKIEDKKLTSIESEQPYQLFQ